MDWRSKVELFEQIRREYEFGVGTILAVWRLVKSGFDSLGQHRLGRLRKRDKHADFRLLPVNDMPMSRTMGTPTFPPPFTETIAFSVVLPSGLK